MRAVAAEEEDADKAFWFARAMILLGEAISKDPDFRRELKAVGRLPNWRLQEWVTAYFLKAYPGTKNRKVSPILNPCQAECLSEFMNAEVYHARQEALSN